MRKNKLSASLMCANLINLEKDIKELEKNHVDYLHIDIMDSSFVPNLTFGPDLVNSIRNITSTPLDIHLLMNKPSVVIRSLNIKDSDIVTIHCECHESIMENIAYIKQKGARFGLALNPDTTIEEVRKYLPYVDVILLMLIVPGFAGSTIIHGIMEKVAETRGYLNLHKFTEVEICVDGSITCERASYMSSLGASIFVGGSSGIFILGKNLDETIKGFYNSINQ